jgi:hypothetical protein
MVKSKISNDTSANRRDKDVLMRCEAPEAKHSDMRPFKNYHVAAGNAIIVG